MRPASLANVGFGEFVAALVLSSALSMWVYWHASRHGSRHATAWGIAVFFIWVVVVPLYFIHYYASRRRF